MGLLDHGLADDCSVLEHVLKVDEITVVHVLCIVVCIVEVNDAFLVRIDDLLRKQQTGRDVPADFTGHIVSLNAVDYGVLVGVLLLDLLIIALNEAEDPVVGSVCLSDKGSLIAVTDIFLCDLEGTVCHDLVLDHILDFLNRCGSVELVAFVLNVFCSLSYLAV